MFGLSLMQCVVFSHQRHERLLAGQLAREINVPYDAIYQALDCLSLSGVHLVVVYGSGYCVPRDFDFFVTIVSRRTIDHTATFHY